MHVLLPTSVKVVFKLRLDSLSINERDDDCDYRDDDVALTQPVHCSNFPSIFSVIVLISVVNIVQHETRQLISQMR